MDEWISLKEKTPDKNDDYICSVIIPYGNGKYKTSLRVLHWYLDPINRRRGYFSCEGMIVTHWMTMPKAPEVELKWD